MKVGVTTNTITCFYCGRSFAVQPLFDDGVDSSDLRGSAAEGAGATVFGGVAEGGVKCWANPSDLEDRVSFASSSRSRSRLIVFRILL